MLFNCTQALRYCPKTNFTSVATTELTLSLVLDNSSIDSDNWENEKKLQCASDIVKASDLFTTHAQSSKFPMTLPDINFAVCQQFKDSLVISVRGNCTAVYIGKDDAAVNLLVDETGKGNAVKVQYNDQLKILLLTHSAAQVIEKVFTAGTYASAILEVEKGGLEALLRRSQLWGAEIETDFAAVYLDNMQVI